MTTREDIRKMLVEILEEDTGRSFTDLSDTDSLRESLGLDSVDVVSAVSQVERRMKIRLTHEELEKLTCVGDILDLLVTKVTPTPSTQAA